MNIDYYRNIFATGKRSEVIKAGDELIAELAAALAKQKRAVKRSAFVKPTLEQVTEYMTGIGLNGDNPQAFLDHYESNGWKVGKVRMMSWPHACDNWKRNRDRFSPVNGNGGQKPDPARWNEFLKVSEGKYRGDYQHAPEYLKIQFASWRKAHT